MITLVTFICFYTAILGTNSGVLHQQNSFYLGMTSISNTLYSTDTTIDANDGNYQKNLRFQPCVIIRMCLCVILNSGAGCSYNLNNQINSVVYTI
jgi:hypothetical protein